MSILSSAPIAASNVPEWLAALHRVSPEEVLLPVLVQLVIIILAARLFAALFRRLGQPGVVGEIAAGLVLGPSVLGYFFPQAFHFIFTPGIEGLEPAAAQATLNSIFTTLAHLGLIFLLFLVGLEFDFGHLRWHGKSAVSISLVGVALPFALGLALAPLLLPSLEKHPQADGPINALGFALFLGTALSITAIPVLGRIMMELNITRTRLGAITISAAAVDDAMGWIMLATVAAVVRGQFEPAVTLLMLAETLAFALAMVFLARPLLSRWAKRAMARSGGELGLNDLAVLLTFVLLCAVATNRIGIFAIFGAFLLGAILSGEHELREAIGRRLRDFVTAFFLPIFFTFTGLRTNIGSLESGWLWLLCAAVCAAAMFGKLFGCGMAARLTGFSNREAACIGTMMNTRGLMELIVINVGYELRVIPPSVFCMLVIMALLTTIMTTPLLLALMRGTELEPYVRASEFYGGKAGATPAAVDQEAANAV